MPVYKYRALGQAGVISDAPAYDLPAEAWNDAFNVRFVNNRIEKMLGFSLLRKQVNRDIDPFVFTQEPEADSQAIIYACNNRIFRIDGSVLEDISEAPNYRANKSNPWNYTILSNTVVLNNPIDNPVGWVPATRSSLKTVTTLPGWGVPKIGGPQEDWKAKVIRSYKNYLIALNMTETSTTNGTQSGSVEMPQRIRWSNIAYVNALPQDWHDDDTNGDGGFNDFSDCTGEILDGRPLRDYFMIYTNKEVYTMRLVGGQFLFDFVKLFPDAGVLNTNCVTEFEGGNHFVVSENDIYIHDGSTRRSIAKNIVLDRILNDIFSVNYKATRVFSNPVKKEIWLCYATADGNRDVTSYACNKAAVWNWETGVWTFCNLPDIYWMEPVLTFGNDKRTWTNPDDSPLSIPTQIRLDSPFESLPINKEYRIEVIYREGEGYIPENPATKLKWTLSNVTGTNVASFVQESDQSISFKSLNVGKVKIRVELAGIPAIFDEYTVEVTAAGTPTVLRYQRTDNDPTISVPPSYNYRPDQDTDPSNQWDSPNHEYDEWDKVGFSFTSKIFAAVSLDRCMYTMESGTVQERWNPLTDIITSQPVSSFVYRYGIAMADIEQDLSYHKTWRTIYPLISGEGNLKFTISGSDNAYVPPSGGEQHYFQIGDDYKIDCFVNRRYLSILLKDDSEGSWSFTGMDVDYFLGGNR